MTPPYHMATADSNAAVLQDPAADTATAMPAAKGYVCRDLAVALSSTTGPRTILQDVDLDIAQGEIVTVVGRSGTGKTTLLRVLGGLVQASAGVVSLNGDRVNGPPTSAVTVFQDYSHALLPWRTVERNVALGLEGRADIPRADRDQRVREALDSVSLGSCSQDRPWQLSGGMQQRVQIARALALRPRVLLMDEPFGALDAMTKAALQDELLAIQQRSSATIMFVTHDIEEAIYLGDRVVVLSGQPGRITEEIPVDLPRPRDHLTTKELPGFLRLRHAVHDAVRP